MAITEHSPPSFVGVANNHIYDKQEDLNHHGIINGLEVGICAHKLTGEEAVEHDTVWLAGDNPGATHSVRESCTLNTRTGLYNTVVTLSGLLHGTHSLGMQTLSHFLASGHQQWPHLPLPPHHQCSKDKAT